MQPPSTIIGSRASSARFAHVVDPAAGFGHVNAQLGFGGERLEEVNRVAVRITEQHGAVAPGHVLGLLQPVAYEAINTLAFSVHVVDGELKDCRPVGGCRPLSTMHELGGLSANDCENGTLRVELDVVVVTLWRGTQQFLVEGSEASDIFRNETGIGEFHVDTLLGFLSRCRYLIVDYVVHVIRYGSVLYRVKREERPGPSARP